MIEGGQEAEGGGPASVLGDLGLSKTRETEGRERVTGCGAGLYYCAENTVLLVLLDGDHAKRSPNK